jgi:hypothetical protein
MNHRKAYSPGTVLVLVGTKRGLFLLTSRDRETWEVETTALKGSRVFFATLDQRDGQRLFAADNGDFFGTFLRYSDDFGQTWQEPEQGIQFPEGGQQKLENIWTIVPGRPTEAGTVYAGIDPASLWVSKDGGMHWEIVGSLERGGYACIQSLLMPPMRLACGWGSPLSAACAQTMEARAGCSQIRTRELTSCRRSIQNMGNAYTALCSTLRSRMYCTSRTIVAFIRVSTQVMIGSIFNTTCLPNLAFQSRWTLTTPIPCTSSLRTLMGAITSTSNSRYTELRMVAKSGKP